MQVPSKSLLVIALAVQSTFICWSQEPDITTAQESVFVFPDSGPVRERIGDEPETGLLQRLLQQKDQSLRVSGEWREQYEYWRGREFGLIPEANNDYLLQRIYLNFEYEPTTWFRAQTEVGSSFQFGSPFAPGPIDEDALYFQQLFTEIALLETYRGKLATLLGRQTFSLGSGRLVAIRNGPNVRRSFDAARLRFKNERIDSQLLFGSDVSFGGDAFDNQIRSDRLLWGCYHTFLPGADSVLPGSGGLDVYYLGYRNSKAVFDSVSGNERRHSFGVRAFGLFGSDNAWDYNVESVFQLGSLEEKDISAWTFASVLGHTFADTPLSPRVGAKFDIISGDRDPADNILGTFNAYFPNNSYFSEAAIFAPANLFDLNFNLDLQVTDQVTAVLLWDFLWRYSELDSIYVPPGVPAFAGNLSSARYIGNSISVALTWKPREWVESTTALVHLDSGSAVTEANSSDINFALLWVTCYF
ncbi:alginate export family protein [Pirellulaceae bacterium SH449]